jgi:hypothetical protein
LLPRATRPVPRPRRRDPQTERRIDGVGWGGATLNGRRRRPGPGRRSGYRIRSRLMVARRRSGVRRLYLSMTS